MGNIGMERESCHRAPKLTENDPLGIGSARVQTK